MRHLLENSVITRKIFSLCLGFNGGMFNLGAVNSTKHFQNNEIRYLDYIADELYKVKLKEIVVGEYSVKANVLSGLDTGTTNTYFPRAIFEEFFKMLKETCSQQNACFGDILKVNDEICIYKKKGVTQNDFYYSMPIFSFIFHGNFTYEWKALSYLYKGKGLQEFCMNIHQWEYIYFLYKIA